MVETLVPASIPPAAPSTAIRLEQVQFLRFLAAASVLLGHAMMEGKHSDLLPSLFDPIYNFPWGAGVDVFFVISGFIMFFVSADKTPGVNTARTFIAKRIRRVVPLYWFFTLLMLIAILLFPDRVSESDTGWGEMVSSLLFVPYLPNDDGLFRPVLAQGWTLNYEMYFYACFAVTVLLTIRWRFISIALIMLTIVALSAISNGSVGALTFYGNTVVIEFLLGGAIFFVMKKGGRVNSAVCLAGIALAVAMLCLAPETPNQTRVIYWGLPAFILSSSVILCAGRIRAVFSLPIFQVLGDASYALYLSHPFAYNFLLLALVHVPGPLAKTIYVPVALLVCLAAAVFVNRLIERPLDRFIGTLMPAPNAPARGVAQ